MSQFQKTPRGILITPKSAGFNFLSGPDGPIPVPHQHMNELYETLEKPQVPLPEQSRELKQENNRAVEIDPSLSAFPGKAEVTDPSTTYRQQ